MEIRTNKLLKIIGLISLVSLFGPRVFAQEPTAKPDTVYTGIYITSIHDIDFKDNEYTISLWLWMKYKNREFDFLKNLEVPMAKTVTTSFATVDSSGESVSVMMKLQCVMKDNWKIGNFPFDRQKLRLSFENSQYSSKYLVFAADTVGKHFDSKFTLSGWNIDTFSITVKPRIYETAFGDESLSKPQSEYSAYKVKIGIKREALGLFWKMFIGMYVSFLIAYVCFYIYVDSIESRFGLGIGALFGVIGNKYIIDSALPESTTFTLVDTLHGLTLAFILFVVTATVYSLRLVKKNKFEQAKRFDMICAQTLLTIYVILNGYYILSAYFG